MASRMRKRSVLRTASWASVREFRWTVIAIAASTAMMAITTTSSISVQPR